MSNNTEKAAYIRGLVEGLELEADKKETKVINAMLELLEDMAFSIQELTDEQEEMSNQLDEVDEDLAALEDEYYDSDDEEDGCCCGCHDHDDDDEDEDDCYYEVTCPNCKETVCLSEDVITEGKIDCPNCGETLEFDLDDVAEEDK